MHPGEPSCRLVPPGTYHLSARLDERRAEASIEVAGGAVAERTLVLRPSPAGVVAEPLALEEVPEESRDCGPELDLVYFGERAYVGDVVVGTGLLPGDEVLEYDELWGPEAEPVAVTVRRPDGSTAQVSLARTRCD